MGATPTNGDPGLVIWGIMSRASSAWRRICKRLSLSVPFRRSMQLCVRLCSSYCHQREQIEENAFRI